MCVCVTCCNGEDEHQRPLAPPAHQLVSSALHFTPVIVTPMAAARREGSSSRSAMLERDGEEGREGGREREGGAGGSESERSKSQTKIESRERARAPGGPLLEHARCNKNAWQWRGPSSIVLFNSFNFVHGIGTFAHNCVASDVNSCSS